MFTCNFTTGGTKIPLGVDTMLTLTLDGKAVATAAVKAADVAVTFDVNIAGMAEGWYLASVTGLDPSWSVLDYGVYVRKGAVAQPGPWMPVTTASHELIFEGAQRYQQAWVPTKFEPVTVPYPSREFPDLADGADAQGCGHHLAGGAAAGRPVSAGTHQGRGVDDREPRELLLFRLRAAEADAADAGWSARPGLDHRPGAPGGRQRGARGRLARQRLLHRVLADRQGDAGRHGGHAGRLPAQGHGVVLGTTRPRPSWWATGRASRPSGAASPSRGAWPGTRARWSSTSRRRRSRARTTRSRTCWGRRCTSATPTATGW